MYWIINSVYQLYLYIHKKLRFTERNEHFDILKCIFSIDSLIIYSLNIKVHWT